MAPKRLRLIYFLLKNGSSRKTFSRAPLQEPEPELGRSSVKQALSRPWNWLWAWKVHPNQRLNLLILGLLWLLRKIWVCLLSGSGMRRVMRGSLRAIRCRSRTTRRSMLACGLMIGQGDDSSGVDIYASLRASNGWKICSCAGAILDLEELPWDVGYHYVGWVQQRRAPNGNPIH